ncbi:MAG: hypothetical protein AB7G44_07255 [Bacteroidia bacterium]
MEFNLTDITGFIEIISNMSISAIPLILAFAVPLFYIAFKKLAGAPDTESKNIFDRLAGILQLPKVESWVLVFSVILFVIGCITVKLEQSRIEKLRQLGWGIKNYFIENSIYSKDIGSIKNVFPQTDSCELVELTNYFPKQFVLVPEQFNSYIFVDSSKISSSINSFYLYLTDTVVVDTIISKNVKLLAAYLKNNAVLKKGSFRSFDKIFNENKAFTFRVSKQLVISYPEDFEINTDIDSITNKIPFGVVRK